MAARACAPRERDPDRHGRFGRRRVRRALQRRHDRGRPRRLEGRLPLGGRHVGHDARDDPGRHDARRRAASTSSAAAATRARRRPTSRSRPASPGRAARSASATRSGALVDGVGWGTATNALVEGTAAAAPPATAAPGSSLVRLPDGHDTNANAADFTVSVDRDAEARRTTERAGGDLDDRAWAYRSCAATSTELGGAPLHRRRRLPAACPTSRRRPGADRVAGADLATPAGSARPAPP